MNLFNILGAIQKSKIKKKWHIVINNKKIYRIIIKNCKDRIDQKDSLYFLRTEITPMINSNGITNKNLLYSLTNILFYKDMNLLTEYIKKNLNMYSTIHI